MTVFLPEDKENVDQIGDLWAEQLAARAHGGHGFSQRAARLLVEASLPSSLTPIERRFAIARRFYGQELPEQALLAHARHLRGKRFRDRFDATAAGR